MRIAASVTTAAATAWTAPALAPVVPPLCRALGIARRMPDGEGGVALTFDDGPHPEGTPGVLEALDAAGAKATFFLVGEQVARRPALAAEIAAAGHRLGSHGHRHRSQLRLGPRELARDLARAEQTILDATGQDPSLYRPPYGIFSAAGLALVRRRGWTPVLWSRWGRDWSRRASPAGIATKVTENVVDGDVLLLHDADYYSPPGSWRKTMAAVPRVLASLEASGLEPVRL
jgi:peptidoglycan/xylan/chitin deacetylase (PgdA/CDA1 family)